MQFIHVNIHIAIPVESGDRGGLLFKYALQAALPSWSSAALVPAVAVVLLLSLLELKADVSADRLKLLELLSFIAFTTCIYKLYIACFVKVLRVLSSSDGCTILLQQHVYPLCITSSNLQQNLNKYTHKLSV